MSAERLGIALAVADQELDPAVGAHPSDRLDGVDEPRRAVIVEVVARHRRDLEVLVLETLE